MSVHTSPWPEDPRPVRKAFQPLAFIEAFESGDLDEETLVDGFQHLIDSGLVWNLQGVYGRTAIELADRGLVTI